jgi:Spy/CpxP family protein refolding chaperone
MTRLAPLLLLLLLVMPGTVPGQDDVRFLPYVTLAPAGQHPTSLALQHWEELDLDDAQIREIRSIENEFVRVMMEALRPDVAATPDPTVWWSEVEPDRDELRRRFSRGVEQEVDAYLHMVETGRQVYRLLRPAQRERLKDLQVQSVEESMQTPGIAARSCRSGGQGGGMSVLPGIVITYGVSFDGDTATVDAVFVGRAEHAFYSSIPPHPRSESARGGGGSMGVWSVMVDRDSRTAWIHDRPVELGANNLVLLDGIDGIRQPPEIVAMLRMPPRIHTRGCEEERFSEILLRSVKEVPEVRAFLDLDDAG